MKQVVYGNGRGHCRVCGRTSGFTAYEVKQIERRAKHEPNITVAAAYGVHPSSLRRHMLNHADRVQVVRDVRLDEDRSALDIVDNQVEQYFDADRIRIEALSKGEYAVSLRASNTMRAIARQLLNELGVDVAAIRNHAADTDVLLRAVAALAYEHPLVARSLAEKAADGPVRDQLLALYEAATAAKNTNEENAA